MNDSIQDSDEQTSNHVLPLENKKQALTDGLVRSSSASSSSSFDSCSDLLGSLENAEELPDDSLKLSAIDFKENEPYCGAKGDIECHQASSESENVPGKQSDHVTRERVHSSPFHREDNAEFGKLESTFGLSNAISFSTVRSLAENTVERISQLQTFFPSSYIFPLKNVLQTSNASLPAGLDAQMGAGSDVSDFSKDESTGKEPNLRERVDGRSHAYRNFVMKTSTLLPKELGEMLHVPDNNMSSKNIKSDDLCTEGLCIHEEFGVMGHVISMLNKESNIANEHASDFLIARKISDTIPSTGDDVEITNISTECAVRHVGETILTEDLSSNMISVDCNGTITTSGTLSRGLDSKSSQSLEHLMISPHFSKHSDINITATKECSQYPSKVGSDEGSDLQHSDISSMSSNPCKKASAFSHPLRTLSSGSGRPDLEEVDGEQNISLNTNKLLEWNSSTVATSSTEVGILQKASFLDLSDFVPLSAATLMDAGLRAGESSSLEEPSFGGILHDERWKSLSIQLESSLHFDEREKKDSLGPDELSRYVENLELNESYVDTVLDMEDVLLNCDENGSRERFFPASSNSVIGTPRSSRDGSMTSSTSGLHLFTTGESTPFMVDWVEVIGAKQRRGGSSFGERIVGVKDHTVYCIKVSSGSQEWEVFRRYRDFVDLYHQLRHKFNVRTEKSLPSPWKEVDRDSRQVFGSTHPNVVEVRSSRIERCLQSLLQAGPPLSTCSPLCWFLCPQNGIKGISSHESHHLTSTGALLKGHDVQLGSIESPYLQSPRSEVGSHKGDLDHDKICLSLGKTVKLNLKTHPNKNLKQLLASQHHSCAGCYKHLEAERGLVHGFVQTLGWGKPRLCEYSGQLYCSSCHLNEMAVLPAQVLWHWDFTPRRVSQLAKAYLDSIYDQPMLCVSAVNPYLYSRVPILSHVKETRRKLSKMLACMLCPFRTRILQTMASRRYLLENNDFFALRDLEDLSKGAFAVLPSLLKAVLENLRLHVMKQCSVCSETGKWCGAGIFCEEPFSPIFPFEEENITTCKDCHALFHKDCFSKFASCPACLEDENKKSRLLGAFEYPQTEKPIENHRDVALLLGGEGASASLVLAGEGVSTFPSLPRADSHGGFELDNQPQTHKNWPSFYSLLPRTRLW